MRKMSIDPAKFVKKLELPIKDWKEIAKWLIESIKKETQKGALVNGDKLPYKRNKPGKSNYADYKSRGMRRYTDGRRLKRYAGKKIKSTNGEYVDMTLTGRLLNSLKRTNVSKKGFTLQFTDPEADTKLDGALFNDREVLGINKKNGEQLTAMFKKAFDSQLKSMSTFYSYKAKVSIRL